MLLACCTSVVGERVQAEVPRVVPREDLGDQVAVGEVPVDSNRFNVCLVLPNGSG